MHAIDFNDQIVMIHSITSLTKYTGDNYWEITCWLINEQPLEWHFKTEEARDKVYYEFMSQLTGIQYTTDEIKDIE